MTPTFEEIIVQLGIIYFLKTKCTGCYIC
jgi:hypothetical protein